MSTQPANLFSPDYFSGQNVAPGSDTGYEPRPFTYIYAPPNNQLTASQVLPNDSKQIDNDSDFLLLGWYIALFTGVFEIRLADANGYRLMSGFLNSGAISQASNDPTVFDPSHPFPAGSKITIDINDLSGAPNPLQIAFVGIKLYRVKRNDQ